MGDLSDFQRGQIVVAHLVGVSLIKTATLLGVSGAGVSKVMTAHTNYGKTLSPKRNSGRNPKRSEGYRRTLERIVSKNHRTAAPNVTAELNTHLEDPLSTKTVRQEFHKSNIHGRAAIAKILITENSTKSQRYGVMIIKPVRLMIVNT
jgi:transposase